MQTKRTIYLVGFGLLVSWVVATLQIYANPNNWSSFKTWHASDWAASIVGMALAATFALLLLQMLVRTDRKIEKSAKDSTNELKTAIDALKTEMVATRATIQALAEALKSGH